MPNYCNNNLKVSGSLKDITDFYENNMIDNDAEQRQTSKNLTFGYVVPEPKFDNKEDEEKYKKAGWYEWRIENWGTKWDAITDYVDYKPENSELNISFETAWTPPIKWLEKAQIRYPKLKFYLSYYEDGLMFKGVAKTIKSNIVNKVKEIQ
jgi:hypothetical protein